MKLTTFVLAAALTVGCAFGQQQSDVSYYTALVPFHTLAGMTGIPSMSDQIQVFIHTSAPDTKAFTVTVTYQCDGQTVTSTVIAERLVSPNALYSIAQFNVTNANDTTIKSVVIDELISRASHQYKDGLCADR